MNRFRILLTAIALAALTAFALVTPGCTKQGTRRITDPASRQVDPADFRDVRWITSEADLRASTERAAKSPLMARAVQDQASDPRLSLLPGGVVGAAGVAKNGSQVQITLLPYQYSDDQNRAVYFVLIEVNGVAHVESFEMMRNRRPDLGETDFERVNSGEHGLWMRSGPTYVQTATGVARRAPEKFNFQKFAWCFMPLADRALGAAHDVCDKMGNFPGCITYGSGIAMAAAAIYCAWAAYSS